MQLSLTAIIIRQAEGMMWMWMWIVMDNQILGGAWERVKDDSQPSALSY